MKISRIIKIFFCYKVLIMIPSHCLGFPPIPAKFEFRENFNEKSQFYKLNSHRISATFCNNSEISPTFCEMNDAKTCNFDRKPVRKRADLVELVNFGKMILQLQNSASIQPRTDLPKFTAYRYAGIPVQAPPAPGYPKLSTLERSAPERASHLDLCRAASVNFQEFQSDS